MKKRYIGLAGVALLLLIAAAVCWSWAQRYAYSTAIPDNVILSDWAIGGMEQDEFEQQLKERIEALEQTPVTFTFPGTEVNSVSTTLAKLGVHYQADQLIAALKKLQEGGLWERIEARRQFKANWALQFSWDNQVWKQRFHSQWEIQTFGKPVNATRTITKDDKVVYTPDQAVFRLDRMQMEQVIRVAIPSEWHKGDTLTIEVPLIKQDAPVTVKSLKAEGIDRKIIEISTFLKPGDAGRIHNVVSAAKTINDMVLKPGDIFDYEKVIAETEKAYGFQEAPVIFNGKLVPGIGGGICQVSSTLYNAVLRTGLEIVERRNHSLPVAYLPIGLDATFSEGYINFRFKNTTGKNLLIRTSSENNQLTIKLFGTLEDNVTYKMETKTVQVIQPTVKYVKNSSLPVGSQETIQKGKQGYKVESYRIKLVDGKEVSREKMYVDTYKAQPTLIAVNNGAAASGSDKPSNPEPILEDGVTGPNF